MRRLEWRLYANRKRFCDLHQIDATCLLRKHADTTQHAGTTRTFMPDSFPNFQWESHSISASRGTTSASLVICGANKPSKMHSRLCLAFALMMGPALSQLPSSTFPLNLVSPGNVAPAPNSSLGLRLPISNTTTQQPSNSSYIYDLSSATNSTLTAGYVAKCQGLHFGFNLDRHSCFDAFRNIPPTAESKKWGPRHQDGAYDYEALPFRWSSGKPRY